jgi:hypothetical protein
MAEYYKNAGAATKANIKTTPGNVTSFRVTNVNAAIRYFQIHDKATAPAGSDTALRSWVVPAGTATVPTVLMLGRDYLTEQGIKCLTGVGFAVSTTDTTFTDSATAAEHSVEVNYN